MHLDVWYYYENLSPDSSSLDTESVIKNQIKTSIEMKLYFRREVLTNIHILKYGGLDRLIGCQMCGCHVRLKTLVHSSQTDK